MRQINIINREVTRLGFPRFLEIVNSMRRPRIAFDNIENPSFVYAKNKNGSVLYFYRITFAGEFIKSKLIAFTAGFTWKNINATANSAAIISNLIIV